MQSIRERWSNTEERKLYLAALRKSLPYIIAVEVLGVLALVALFVFYSPGDSVTAGAAAGFEPVEAPPVNWPDPDVYTAEDSNPRRFMDLPWEVSDGRGAVLVPDVFYADDFQNEQVMPTALPLKLGREGRPYEYRIRRLIYPTIGNPALHVRETNDQLRVVLRFKRPDYAHLAPSIQPAGVEWAPHLNEINFEKTDERNRIAVYLLSRKQRSITESFTSVPVNVAEKIEIKPESMFIHDRETVPRPLRSRDTIQFVFSAEDLKQFEPGLYDLRLEVFLAGRLHRYEFQYNAVRIFDSVPENYSVLNITDSQVSMSKLLDGVPNQLSFREISHEKLRRFVDYVKTSPEDIVKNAAFITFNGDLHNGGSPGTLLPEDVALAYNREARGILEILRELPVPLFLTPGNHDGYVSMGHVPTAIRLQLAGQFIFKSLWGGDKTLGEIIEEYQGLSRRQVHEHYLAQTKGQPGGWHRDVFTGRFVRRGRTDQDGAFIWRLLPDSARNLVLYDGFYQWRQTYGPLFYSFHFGQSHYVVLNTYDLRQHRRSGWGMYTVNYGGGVSPFQMNWLRRDIQANEAAGRDITLIAHHDPRGGHNGEDYPYYFEMIQYTGMGESAVNYVKGEILNPLLCGNAPKWSQSKSDVLSCMHDGLQEWMRADPDFDCEDHDLFEEGDRAGFCDTARLKSETFEGNPSRPVYSGYQLLHRLAKHKSIRTLLLGHTHYNSLEILQPGDEIVPGQVVLDLTADKKYAQIEVENPLRRHAHEDLDSAEAAAADEKPGVADPDPSAADASREQGGENQGELEKIKITEKDGVPVRVLDLLKSGHDFERRLRGHELAILRMTSMADLSLQQFQGKPLYGFSVLEVFPMRDSRAYSEAQINRVYYFQATGAAARAADIKKADAETEAESENESEVTAADAAEAAKAGESAAAKSFARVAKIDLVRTERVRRRGENPLLKLFRLPDEGAQDAKKEAETRESGASPAASADPAQSEG